MAARGRLAGRAPSRFPLDTEPAPAELPAPSARIRFLLSAGARGKALLYRPAGRPRSQLRRGAAAAWAAMGELPLALLALAALRCAGAPGKISAFLATSQGPPPGKFLISITLRRGAGGCRQRCGAGRQHQGSADVCWGQKFVTAAGECPSCVCLEDARGFFLPRSGASPSPGL